MAKLINDRVQKLKEKIADISAGLGINSDNIHLVAISKKQSIEKIIEAHNAGIKYFGENKVQEIVNKFENISLETEWHFVGHLQKNKVKYLINKVKLIHSVDSLELAEKISHLSIAKEVKTDILLQVNTSEEESKFGFMNNELDDKLELISLLKNIRIRGLMAMAPFTSEVRLISNSFSSLRNIYEKIDKMSLENFNMQYLSMGMSNDYEIALKEGSNMLRIGTSIFGPRD